VNRTCEKNTDSGVSDRLTPEEQEQQDELKLFEELMYRDDYDPYESHEARNARINMRILHEDSLHAEKSSAAPPAPPAPAVDVDEAFACFWEYYPRKDKRERAYQAFSRIVQAGGVDIDAIVDGAAHYDQKMTYRYKNRDERDRFTELPSNWLDRKGWEDDSAKSLHADSVNHRPLKRFTNRRRKDQSLAVYETAHYYDDGDIDIDTMCTEKLTKLFG
jgi:hypothetical protein